MKFRHPHIAVLLLGMFLVISGASFLETPQTPCQEGVYHLSRLQPSTDGTQHSLRSYCDSEEVETRFEKHFVFKDLIRVHSVQEQVGRFVARRTASRSIVSHGLYLKYSVLLI